MFSQKISNVPHFYDLIVLPIIRTGPGLKELYKSPMVQHFYNFVPMKEVHSEKRIYQQGVLRKVCMSVLLC